MFHRGIDLAAPIGTPIIASADGIIEVAGWRGAYGRYVRIGHGNGVSTGYGHLREYASTAVVGSSVRQGEVIGYLGSSRSKTAQVQIESLVTSLELFHIDVGRYPSTTEGLEALVKPVGTMAGWKGPYLTKSTVPLDPWGKAYVYEAPGKTAAFDLYTLGRDGKEGGADEDGDIRH